MHEISHAFVMQNIPGMFRKHLFQMFRYICLLNIRLSDAYIGICVEMFIVARGILQSALLPTFDQLEND